MNSDCRDGFPWSPSNYSPIIRLFGQVEIRIDQANYQGDTWVLYKEGNDHVETGRYGYLCFGWGSCSGCDALQACTTYEQCDALIDHMESRIVWFDDKASALKWFAEHDHKGDYNWNIKEFHEFLSRTIDYLSQESQ